MKKTYSITRENLRKRDFKAGNVSTGISKSVEKLELLAPVLKELLDKKY